MPNDYYGIIPAVIRYDKTLSAIDRLVFCDIHARSNSKGYCWPSNKQIGDDLGFSSRAISRSIKVLAEREYIDVEDRPELSTHRGLRPRLTSLPPRLTSPPPTTGQSTPPRLTSPPKDSKEKDSKRRREKAFIPPTLAEVTEYVEVKALNVDPKYFFDFFTEGSWIDTKGNPVRNWKQKAMTWSRMSKTQDQPAQQPKRRFSAGNKFTFKDD